MHFHYLCGHQQWTSKAQNQTTWFVLNNIYCGRVRVLRSFHNTITSPWVKPFLGGNSYVVFETNQITISFMQPLSNLGQRFTSINVSLQSNPIKIPLFANWSANFSKPSERSSVPHNWKLQMRLLQLTSKWTSSPSSVIARPLTTTVARAVLRTSNATLPEAWKWLTSDTFAWWLSIPLLHKARAEVLRNARFLVPTFPGIRFVMTNIICHSHL